MPRGRSKSVKDSEIVDVVGQWPKDGKLPSTSNLKDEINEQLEHADYGRKTVYRRLESLASEGRIAKVEVGMGRGRSIGWYDPEAHTPGERTNDSSGSPQPMASGGMLTVAPENPNEYGSNIGPVYFEDRFDVHAWLNLLLSSVFTVAALLAYGAGLATGNIVLAGIGTAAGVLAGAGFYWVFVADTSDTWLDTFGGWGQKTVKRLRRELK